MKTNWLGLWEQGNGTCTGDTFQKSDIPKYTRLVLVKNKYYKEGTKRPKYIYCFADSEGIKHLCDSIEVEQEEGRPYEENGTYYTEDGERLYTGFEVRRIINGTAEWAENGYSGYDIRPEDFV